MRVKALEVGIIIDICKAEGTRCSEPMPMQEVIVKYKWNLELLKEAQDKQPVGGHFI